MRDVPLVVETAAFVEDTKPELRPHKRSRHWLNAALAVPLVAVVLGRLAWAGPTSASLANLEMTADEPVSVHEVITTYEIAPPEPDLLERFPMPVINGVSLDEKYPSLAVWTHPVAATIEPMSTTNRSRQFGSSRHGIERPECGQGHCGVDLDGPRGRPIVAVAAGIVIRIERREHGADGRSGRYVRIQHDDGPLTAYMHLDDVAEDLKIGDRVTAGHYVGTLGASGINASAPHLHFTLEVPKRHWERGDHLETTFLDPAPYLVRAKILPVRDGRIKPAS